MSYKDIARLIPTIQAAKLAERNIDFSKKKKKSKDYVGQSMENIVGITLIGTTAKIIEDL